MTLSRNQILFIRLFLGILLLFLFLFFINRRIDLRPNSLLLNLEADYKEDNHIPEIYLDTGEGFKDIALSPGELSHGYISDLESLRISFSRKPLFSEADFSLEDYIVKDNQKTSVWTARFPRYEYDLKDTKNFIFTTQDMNVIYQVFVNGTSWPLAEEDGLLLAENPGVKVEQPGTLKIAKSTKTIKNMMDFEDLSHGVDSVAVIKREPNPIAIESITMERYFGRLNLYLPSSLKTWEAEEILKDFNILSKNYWIDDGTLFIDSSSPHLKLEYKDSFGRTYKEIDQIISTYYNLLSLFALSSAIIFFFLSGLFFNNLKRMTTSIIPYLKTLFMGINSKLAILFSLSLLLLMLTSATYIKATFFLFAFISGAAILYINRDKLEQDQYTKSINSKGYLAVSILIVAMIIGTIIFSYKLGEHDVREDEFQVIDAAGGYFYEGDYYSWDWLEDKPGVNFLGASYYDRAFPHTFLIVQSYKLFGISEWSTRIVSLFFGILFIPLFYISTRFFTENDFLALLAVFISIFYDSYIFIFRYARMYALLIPLFLILIYFTYRGLTEKSLMNRSVNQFYGYFKNNLNFHYFYLLIALIILYLTYLIHVNALIILPATLLFVFIMFFITTEKKYLNLALIVIAGLLIIVLAYYLEVLQRYLRYFSFFERRNFDYLEHLTKYPFPWELGTVLLALGLVAVILIKGKLKNKLLFLYIVTLFSLFFFIFIGDRYSHFLYTSHITPISIILILFSCFMLMRALNNKLSNIVFAALLFFLVGTSFYQNIDIHYGNSHRYGSFSRAYEIIIDNYNPEKEVIFGQYLRDFYLQELQDTEVETINMKNNGRYSFETFMEDLQKYEAGWITWETRKSYHLERDIIDFIDNNFKKLHGERVDDSKVEVYYFEDNMFEKILKE